MRVIQTKPIQARALADRVAPHPRRYMILPGILLGGGFALWVVTWSAFQPGLGWLNPLAP